MKHTKNMIIKESIESNELALYAANERDIYFARVVPVVKNLAKYYKRGNFNADRAIDAFYPVATAAANKYCRVFANIENMPHVFNVTTRYTAAAALLNRFMDNIIKNDP